ncbi:MAG: efflux RND transporter permease subunit, partial [Steroidobacteraceae bacterium]
MSDATDKLGLSGRLARTFLDNELTPLIALTLMLLGVFAVLVTPREEEPQIDVTMANVIIAAPGASVAQVENLVASPMEQVLGEIEGVEHLYSVSRPGVAILTVQYKVGVPRNDAIVRLYNAVYSNRDWRPAGLGVLEPIIKPKGIDDVPIIDLTLWTKDKTKGAYELKQVAHAIEAEIKRVPGTRNVYTIGGPDDTVHVLLDPAKLSGFGLTALNLQGALAAANVVMDVGSTTNNNNMPVRAGEFLSRADEVADLIVGLNDGKPIYLQDVADIRRGSDQPEQYVKFATGPAAAEQSQGDSPAVTIAVSKQPGRNAIDVTDGVVARVNMLHNRFIPEGIELTVTRNYGVTANDKAQKLIQKLMFATVSVIVLVVVAVGWREAVTVGTAVVVTLAATLFASWAWGFTINRVSLFALIFSIGILVDDAIVVVENIHRHLGFAHKDDPLQVENHPLQIVPRAVDEVGGPTILATFTVIAALLPMAFVSGLMGPYMSPIPINASMGMLISLAVALIITPWLSRKLLAGVHHEPSARVVMFERRIASYFEATLRPFLQGKEARSRRHKLYWYILVAILLAIALVGVKLVVLKMLPFDNKSEFQVVVNMPEGTALEQTAAVLDELSAEISKLPEVVNYQSYAGTSAPINFNGLVRQYYLRSGPLVGDIQVNLVDKHQRARKSHEIAMAVRPVLSAIGKAHNAVVQVVEVPPGPPVQAPIVAEIYAPSVAVQRGLTTQLRQFFDNTADIVDIDDTNEAAAQRYVLDIDRNKAALFGVSQAQIVGTLNIALNGSDATYIRAGHERYPIPIRVELPVADKATVDALLSLEVQGATGKRIPLSELINIKQVDWDGAIYHKDLLPVTYITADMAGKLDSPLYGMFDIISNIESGLKNPVIEQHFISQPDNPSAFAIKWDGEWQITYETFRDMGLAYSVGLLLIYLLVVAQFRSYAVPLIIMAPIPLTLIGIMPGHALLGAQFTATSMIGMIALAGIIVRNSILLVDFINLELAQGKQLIDAVVQATIVRTKPIVLTGLAAMMGAFFILDDPIFNGLAVSLIFGILVSTLLTLIVIPVLYFSYL